MVGAYSCLIADAERRHGADDEAARHKRLRAACQEVRRRLNSDARKNIARVHSSYASRIRDLADTGE